MAEKISPKSKVSTAVFAAINGVSLRYIQIMRQSGVLTGCGRGMFELSECAALREYAARGEPSEAEKKTEVSRRQSEAVIKASKATISKLQAMELQGKMHRSEDVAKMTEDLIYTIRGMLLGLPGRVAMDTAAATTPSETAEIVRKETYHILQELSAYTYDPAKYEARVRERMSWDVNEADSDEE